MTKPLLTLPDDYSELEGNLRWLHHLIPADQRSHLAAALTEYGEMAREACALEVDRIQSSYGRSDILNIGDMIRAIDVRVAVEEGA